MHQRRQLARPVAASNGDPLTALRVAARWCITAAEHITAEHLDAPSLAPVGGAVVAALANTTRASLDALSLTLARWCERASSDAYDHTALAGLVLSAVDAAGLCSVAETPDAPVAGDPFA
jgi:hypothetical protein